MNSISEDARQGLELLKRAVLKVLEDNQHQGRLGKGKIREYLGLPRIDEHHAKSNSLIEGVLSYLEDDDLVDWVAREGWKLK